MFLIILYLLSVPACFVLFLTENLLFCKIHKTTFKINLILPATALSLVPIVNSITVIVMGVSCLSKSFEVFKFGSGLEKKINDYLRESA